MEFDLRACAPGEREALRSLLADPAIAPQFDKFQGPGFEHKLHDPVFFRDGVRIAWVDGEPVGFGLAWVLPQERETWVMARVAVLERHRRRGIGRRLLESVAALAAATRPHLPVELAGSAWLPNDAAEAFAASAGGTHLRWFWRMDRARGGAAPPEWPAGVVTRAFDGSARAIRDWTEAYNDSFSNHFRFSPARVEDTAVRAADPTFRPDGLLLAYRGGHCVGFCRNELHAARGEIAVLGVTHEARGIGLGRALLRWGVHWLERSSSTPVTLIVDGDNETALRLYRDEGFVVARTRRTWARRIEPARG